MIYYMHVISCANLFLLISNIYKSIKLCSKIMISYELKFSPMILHLGQIKRNITCLLFYNSNKKWDENGEKNLPENVDNCSWRNSFFGAGARSE